MSRRERDALVGIITAVIAMSLSGAAEAQPWVSYLAAQDRFAAMFPIEPTVEEMEWTDEHGQARPARRYRAERDGNIYTVLAVDYSGVHDNPDTAYDLLKGAYPHAATVYRRKGEVTYDGWGHTDRIDGHRLQITQPDGRRIYFLAHLHDDILYILDANVSPRAAPPGQFEYSLQILDREGVRVRYDLEGNRMPRTDDLQEALGGPDLEGPIPLGQGDQFFDQ